MSGRRSWRWRFWDVFVWVSLAAATLNLVRAIATGHDLWTPLSQLFTLVLLVYAIRLVCSVPRP